MSNRSPSNPRTRGMAAWVARMGTVCLVWFLMAAPALAQTPPPGGRVVSGGKSYVLEGVFTLLLCALAIFAVGRTGRRN